MPPTSKNAVHVEGLQQLRRALRQIGRDEAMDAQRVIREAATIVAEEAGRLAPRGTQPLGNRRPQKRLADAYVGTTSGARGIVRNPLPHASLFEYRKSGTPAQMAKTRPVERAIEAKADDVLDRLAHGFDVIARIHGFK